MIVAALQDNKRAIVVGERSSADGKVRSLFPLPGGKEQLVLWVGRLERALADRDWAADPDFVVPMTKEQRAAVQKWQDDKQLPELPAGKTDAPPTDPQLSRAVELLRAALQTSAKH